MKKSYFYSDSDSEDDEIIFYLEAIEEDEPRYEEYVIRKYELSESEDDESDESSEDTSSEW